MILYHGSDVIIKEPRLIKQNRTMANITASNMILFMDLWQMIRFTGLLLLMRKGFIQKRRLLSV